MAHYTLTKSLDVNPGMEKLLLLQMWVKVKSNSEVYFSGDVD